MTKRRTVSILGPPLTIVESGGIQKSKPTHKLIACSKCNQPGGTLIKIGDSYIHQKGSGCNI